VIYTVTLNPSLDYIVDVDDFKPGVTNRTAMEAVCAGGKGINVSVVLKNLGFESTALGFIGGFTGQEIKRLLEAQGVCSEFIQVAHGSSRINVKVRSGEESEINGRGPAVDREDIDRLYQKLDRLRDGDTLVLAGSIPPTVPQSMYKDIMMFLAGRNLRIAVDATKDLLVNVLTYHPFLVKPNNHELGEIFGAELKTREEVIPYAKKMQEMGAVNVLVSMAGEGAVLAAGDGSIHDAPAPEGRLINGVGAGDSMVAGFLAGWMEQKDYSHAFAMGIAAGSASAFSEQLATKEEVKAVYRQVRRQQADE